MLVYKFGGASVQSADGVRNLSHILSLTNEKLFVVVSAMGKTTDGLERVLNCYMERNTQQALAELTSIEHYHKNLIEELFFGKDTDKLHVFSLLEELKTFVEQTNPTDYDSDYDHIVAYGELISTSIVSEYLNQNKSKNTWLDMRKLLRTDSNFREANVQMNKSENLLRNAVNFGETEIYVAQGFIGGNAQGKTTTLGREGSDYTAAIVANLLNADSVTIWKDVLGILNADPRIFPDTVLIPELSYYDAVELSHSGAQVIHPKTIKPLENKHIKLYVKPFGDPNQAGSVIKDSTSAPIEVPVLILRRNQVLITMRALDFSFVLEDSLSKIFIIFNKHRLKVSMIQSSAVTISVCIDKVRNLENALDELRNSFGVSFNENLELLTIRGSNDDICDQYTQGKTILLSQKTRRTARFLMKSDPT